MSSGLRPSSTTNQRDSSAPPALLTGTTTAPAALLIGSTTARHHHHCTESPTPRDSGPIRLKLSQPKKWLGNGRDRESNLKHKPTWEEFGGDCLHFTLFKGNKDTMESIWWLAKELKMKPGNLQFAGALAILGTGYTLTRARQIVICDPAKLGQLSGNEFVVTLRDCDFHYPCPMESNASIPTHPTAACHQSSVKSLTSLFSATAIVFEQGRHWSQGVSGLSYVGVVVGQLLSMFFYIFLEVNYQKKIATNPGKAKPEDRVQPAMIGAVLLPIGFFWFAWSTYPQGHWIVSILGGAFFGFGQVLLYISLINYVVDAYPAIYLNRWLAYMKIQPHTPLPGPTASPREYATPLKRSMKAEADVPIEKSLSVSRPKPSSVTSDKENENVAGEIFDVIGENGELWLAKNQDDADNLVGWIWLVMGTRIFLIIIEF
ncbi:hypothetical protein JMJ35_000359 [Cladonia borealis]|uniref:Uncharacterized protein n=1 Tax=Cladonia borealis TaxID=184061 RepID=A0AA39RAZ5_9LECA|nr:hypothetical protein JMJ35_000359 [Cladonia borealis]